MDELENGSTDNEGLEPEEVEGETRELSTKDKAAKAYQELQRKMDLQIQEEREARIRLEEQLKFEKEQKRLQMEQRETVPEKPKKPVMPKNFSLLEASTDENSASARYMLEKMQYEEAKDIYNDWKESQLERERQSRLQQEQQTATKRGIIAEFQKYTTPDKAVRLAEIVEKGDYETVAKAFEALSNQPNKDKQTEQVPLPPGVIPNHTGKTTETHAQKMRRLAEFI